MSIVEALVLGVVQGLTEFLPVSSTAHLRVVPALLGWADPGVAYSAVIQLGSVLAVISYFWRDLWSIGSGSWSALRRKDLADRDVRLLGAILLGTLPICLLGLGMQPILEQPNGPLRSLTVIGAASVVMGLLLFLSERVSKRQRGLDNMGARDGLVVGLGQAMALIPGCSRSGSTLTVALLLNMKRQDAAHFSFLLGVPAITLSGLLELRHLLNAGIDQVGLTNLLVGLCASTAVSYLSIAWLLRFLQNHSTWLFIGYRLAFGVVVLALAVNQVIR